MTNFRPYDPDQQLLLPPSLGEWLPPDHLVWFISETVDQLDLSEIIETYRDGGQGNLPYHPAMMLKILIYAYATGVFSSRRIARQIEENIALRLLAAGNMPEHRTICRFREQHLGAFERLFVQVVQIAGDTGLVRMGTLAVDGTRIRANASKRKDDDEPPKRGGRPRKHPLGKPKPKDQENFTDPESRIMKDGSGAFQQCYNAQTAVDAQERIIVAASVQQSASDAPALIPMVQQAKQNVGGAAKEVLADAGYASEANLKAHATNRMTKALRTKRGRAKYKRRKHIVEPPFGWIKRGLGFRQFSLRGLAKVTGEFNLVCLALNLRRMKNMIRWA